MRIAGVTATWIRAPIPPERQHVSDFGRMATFDTCLVRIETDTGHVGYGEAKTHVGSAGRYEAVCTVVERELRPLLLGADPRNVTGLWERLYSGSRAHYVADTGRTFPVLGRRGITLCAISGIDLALWDLAGRALGVPVWQLLGGRCRESVAAYASGGWAPVGEIGAQGRAYVERGFRAVKIRVGAMDGGVGVSAARVAELRAALGPDIRIMIDAHGTLGVREAQRLCRLIEAYDITWFEEPVSPDDLPGMAEVRASTLIPIAAGESEQTRFSFRDMALARAVDVFQPDPSICGGLTEAARIAALASAFQVQVAPHLWGSAVLFAAGLQLAAACPACVILEYPHGHNPLLHDLVHERFEMVDGRVHVPDRPGLGITIRDDFVREYAYDWKREE